LAVVRASAAIERGDLVMAKGSKGSKRKGASKVGGYGPEDEVDQGENDHIGNVILVWDNKVYFIPAERVGPSVGGVDASVIQGLIVSNAGPDRIEFGIRIPKDKLIKICANN